jgi:hypothetical protein
VEFSINLILAAVLWPEVDSLSKRNKCNESAWGVEGGRTHIRLTTVSPSVSRFSRICGIFDVSQPFRSPRLTSLLCFAFYIQLCKLIHFKSLAISDRITLRVSNDLVIIRFVVLLSEGNCCAPVVVNSFVWCLFPSVHRDGSFFCCVVCVY